MKRTSISPIAASSPSKTTKSDCIRKIDAFTSTSKKCQLVRSKSTFAIENIEHCARPDVELGKCIKQSIADAILDATQSLGGATKVGVTISSVLLDKGDIYIPLSPITANLEDAVINIFSKVEQSKAMNGGNLYGEPFEITVTVLNVNGLPKQRSIKEKECSSQTTPPGLPKQSMKGKGYSSQTTLPGLSKQPIKGKCYSTQTTPPYIIKVNNNDNYSFFYALELMRYYSLYKRGIITRMKWRHINENQSTVLKDKIRILIKEAGILNEPIYYAYIYIHVVQQLWDKNYPGEYKIYIFNNTQTTPGAKSNVKEYQFPILIYQHNNHYDGIKTLTKFVKYQYYCLSCEKGYNKKGEHSDECISNTCLKE